MSNGISVEEKFEDLLDQLFCHILFYSTLKPPLNVWKIIDSVYIFRGSTLKQQADGSIQQILRSVR